MDGMGKRLNQIDSIHKSNSIDAPVIAAMVRALVNGESDQVNQKIYTMETETMDTQRG